VPADRNGHAGRTPQMRSRRPDVQLNWPQRKYASKATVSGPEIPGLAGIHVQVLPQTRTIVDSQPADEPQAGRAVAKHTLLQAKLRRDSLPLLQQRRIIQAPERSLVEGNARQPFRAAGQPLQPAAEIGVAYDARKHLSSPP